MILIDSMSRNITSSVFFDSDLFRLENYSYELPEDMIAQKPAEPRDSSRLLVVERRTGKMTHTIFRNIL